MLASKIIPPRGGDTLWCDLVDAYASLSAPLRAMLDGLVAVHSTAATFSRFQNDDKNGANMHKIAQHAPVRHPVVRVVPETGDKALFVNPTFTNHIEGFSLEESKAVLELLYKVVRRSAVLCTTGGRYRRSRSARCAGTGGRATWPCGTTAPPLTTPPRLHSKAPGCTDAPQRLHRAAPDAPRDGRRPPPARDLWLARRRAAAGMVAAAVFFSLA